MHAAFRGCCCRLLRSSSDEDQPQTTTESSVMIVTCTTTRVVHLELTSTASTESFLLAWRRFVSRRGIHPTKVFSDGGTNFMGVQ